MVNGRKQITKTNFEAITESPEKLMPYLNCGKVITSCDWKCVKCLLKWLNSPAEIAKNDNNEME
jgi:hypothetical protein